MGLVVATKAFFKLLFNKELSQSFESLVDGKLQPRLTEEKPKAATKPVEKPKPAAPKKPSRSDAITVLATLQREARLLDLVSETLDDYSDAQVGAASRTVLKDSKKVLDRLFGLKPLSADQDGSSQSVPEGFDPNQVRLTGNVTGSAPYSGRLAHHGWKATQCEIPTWSGSKEAALIVAPMEVEVS